LEILTATIDANLAGTRLDLACSKIFSQYSRTKLNSWIKSQNLLLNGVTANVRQKVNLGDKLWLNPKLEPSISFAPQDIDLNIVFEDQQILVINKPAGLVVHPGAGNWEGTLLNALLNYSADFANLPRAGIVHRLDKDTSGLMVVAKTLTAQNYLVEQLQTHSVRRVYQAVVVGVPTSGGTICAPIARHPHNRQKMAVVNGGKNAVSHFKILQKFNSHAHIEVQLETGRTHQIRVHMSHLGYPLIGDNLYGGKFKLVKNMSANLRQNLSQFSRQALHAKELSLKHPTSLQTLNFVSDLPQDLVQLLNLLKNH